MMSGAIDYLATNPTLSRKFKSKNKHQDRWAYQVIIHSLFKIRNNLNIALKNLLNFQNKI